MISGKIKKWNLPPPAPIDLRLRKENGAHVTPKGKSPSIPDKKVGRLGMFWWAKKLDIVDHLRLQEISPYFTEERMEKVIVPIISVASLLSLRTLDWLVINYARRFSITLQTRSRPELIIYNSYRDELAHWGRPLFDAFRRGRRIYFEHRGKKYETTVGQLNYLHWCEKNGVLRYALKHNAAITAHMKTETTKWKNIKARAKKKGVKRPRANLSGTAQPTCVLIGSAT